MNLAQRRASAHLRIRSKFGQNADRQQLYCWHNNTQITCYQPDGTRGRGVLSQLLVKDETITIHATRAEFSAEPKPHDDLTLGTAQSSARALRITKVNTTHSQPFYEIELIDPNLSTETAS